MKKHMIGQRISEERLKEIKNINEANRAAGEMKTVEIKPTMQTGYNKDGTIKEEEINTFIHEINNIKEK